MSTKKIKLAELQAGMVVEVIYCSDNQRLSWGKYLVINDPEKLPEGNNRPQPLLVLLGTNALMFLEHVNGIRMISWGDNNEPFEFYYDDSAWVKPLSRNNP